MPIRHFLTVGVAFATAGMIAAVPAIAPPLQPRDVQVVKATEAQIKLAAQLNLTDLVNVFFGVTPQGAFPSDPPVPGEPLLPPVTDAAGTSGISGVIYQLLRQQQGGYTPGVASLDAFFNGGVASLVELYLLASNSDPDQQAAISAFFDGVSELVRLILLDNTTDPDAEDAINTFFDNGTSGLVHQLLNTIGPAETDELVNIFFNIDNPLDSENASQFGASGVTYQLLKSSGVLSPEQEIVVDDLFSGGMSAVVHTQLRSRTSDPDQQRVIDDFFGGGVSEVVRTQLLARTITDPTGTDLVNEFFDNGISGVVRYLLVGPAPVDPNEMMLAKSSAVTESVEEQPTLPKVEALKVEAPKVETPKVEAAVATPLAASAPAVAADPAPAAEAAPAPDPKPKFTAKISEKAADEEEAEDTTDGNKVEPIIIVGTGGPKPGSGSWGIFGQVAQAIHDTIANAGKPASPAASTESETGGAESGS
ncbi:MULTISPECIES: hypothetical protein [unclassified Mycobacterium]|uniref:hypothetical protein n=1 Tax=unclassified Mycobacterium TaxID=2642494 RepID=UPI0029C7D40C|nr:MULTISPECIES: hypothetical protein [unclassified Mycobacterium]